MENESTCTIMVTELRDSGYSEGLNKTLESALYSLLKTRSEATLLLIIKEWIAPGTLIISECWKSHSGLEINEKIPSQFATRYENLVAIPQIFSRKIATLHCVVSGLAKKYEPTILVCKETTDNGE